jgi:hypothetical protein
VPFHPPPQKKRKVGEACKGEVATRKTGRGKSVFILSLAQFSLHFRNKNQLPLEPKILLEEEI